MEVRRFEDLIVWQLAYELQQGVLHLLPAARDFKYCDQIP
jgi:hypothetical protein